MVSKQVSFDVATLFPAPPGPQSPLRMLVVGRESPDADGCFFARLLTRKGRWRETKRGRLDVTRRRRRRRPLCQTRDGTPQTGYADGKSGSGSGSGRRHGANERHANVMMAAAYHWLLFGNHRVTSIAISIIAMTSVLNDFIQNTDKSNMLISFIQMGHLQSVRPD